MNESKSFLSLCLICGVIVEEKQAARREKKKAPAPGNSSDSSASRAPRSTRTPAASASAASKARPAAPTERLTCPVCKRDNQELLAVVCHVSRVFSVAAKAPYSGPTSKSCCPKAMSRILQCVALFGREGFHITVRFFFEGGVKAWARLESWGSFGEGFLGWGELTTLQKIEKGWGRVGLVGEVCLRLVGVRGRCGSVISVLSVPGDNLSGQCRRGARLS